MRGELNRQWQNYGIEKMPAKRRRRTWGRTAGDVMVLAGVIALVVWLWGIVSSFKFQVSSCRLPGLAMMPVGEVAIIGLAVFCACGLGIAAWSLAHEERETMRWVEQLRTRRIAEMEDPFEGEQAGSLSHEEVHRVLVAMAAEGREVRRLVCGALDARLPLVEREEMLEAASRRVAQLVKCAEGLMAALRGSGESSTFQVSGFKGEATKEGRLAL